MSSRNIPIWVANAATQDTQQRGNVRGRRVAKRLVEYQKCLLLTPFTQKMTNEMEQGKRWVSIQQESFQLRLQLLPQFFKMKFQRRGHHIRGPRCTASKFGVLQMLEVTRDTSGRLIIVSLWGGRFVQNGVADWKSNRSDNFGDVRGIFRRTDKSL